MKSLTKISTASVLTLFAFSCATRQHIADFEAISMKAEYVDKKPFVKMKERTTRYCPDHGAKSSGKVIGLIDKGVEQMEKEAKADFLLGASLYTIDGCVEIDATPAKYK